MKIKQGRAAVLAQSRQPLVVDEIALPEELDAGQVLVKVLYTTICGAQINEIDALKGIDVPELHLAGAGSEQPGIRAEGHAPDE